MKIFEGVRPGDVVLGALLTALGVLLMVGNITGQEQDSGSTRPRG